jgi:chemotaxis protein methyltransferase CheR
VAWQLDLTSLVERTIGVQLRPTADTGTLEYFVAARRTALGLTGPEAYVAALETRGPDSDEFQRLTEVVANGQTSFFRDPRQFDAIAEVIGAVAKTRPRPLAIWSAGCSTGEEAYSLAMLCAEANLAAQIVGTDINPSSLKVAQNAGYREWSLRNLPPALRSKYLEAKGSNVRVTEAIRRSVQFVRHNLLCKAPLPDGQEKWDLIVCCNVFIYYSRRRVQEIVRGMLDTLAEDGSLWVSVSESLRDLNLPLVVDEICGRFAHRHVKPEAQVKRQTPVEANPIPAPPALQRPSAPSASYCAVLALLGHGELAAGRRELERFLDIEPDHVPARITLGNICLRQHEFDYALDAYGRAQALDPLLAEVHFLEGVVYRKLGDFERAEQALQRVLFLDERFWPASFLLAGVYMRLGDSAGCERELHRTECAIQANQVGPMFRSYVRGVEATDLSRSWVLRRCRREPTSLGARGRGADGKDESK